MRLEMVCDTTAIPIPDCIVERVTVGPQRLRHDPLASSSFWSLQTQYTTRGSISYPLPSTCSDGSIPERSTFQATRCVGQLVDFKPMMTPLSNSLNCEKLHLTRLPGILTLPDQVAMLNKFAIWRDKVP
ncbi:hypothetical protein HNY73_017488 [Argiope bruennichi]|uniref:Uncharacterized protein n=1 Tax=Argiope bruennichi TaxID=94029 RepID=A0A8T0EB72_ARGBR|nr:hypothetical protein HNY73_017488 [Argiope bruennichi]